MAIITISDLKQQNLSDHRELPLCDTYDPSEDDTEDEDDDIEDDEDAESDEERAWHNR